MSLARRIVTATESVTFESLPPEVVAKVKVCLMDFLSAAYESLDLPWSQQALAIAQRGSGVANIVGTKPKVPVGDAAFVNAVLGHGLVREDMHTGSVSHLGVVVFPTLLALGQEKKVSGRDLITAAVCGYEVSAQIGRALMKPENVRQYRPTGICGPPGAAVAGARAMGLGTAQTISALAFGMNMAAGLNEWPYSGSDEMFFHVGFAARNAVMATQLAAAGAVCSETSLDGTAGFFRALGCMDRVEMVRPFAAGYEILSVFHKAAPACNYAQTASQSALALAREGVKASEIESIRVRSTAAAIAYPGCNHPGPFTKTLQAKMSIHFCVAATLARGVIAEANYRNLNDPEITRLASLTTLELDEELNAAYPQQQGSEVILTLRGGRTLSRRLPDVIPATPAEIRARFRKAAERYVDVAELESAIDTLETASSAARVAEVMAAK